MTDYKITGYSSYSTTDTLGFSGEGQLQINADSMRISGRRRNPTLMRFIFYTYIIFIMGVVVSGNWPDQTRSASLLGLSIYSIILTGPLLIVIILAIVTIIGAKRHTLEFSLTRLRRVLHNDDNITIMIDNGIEPASSLTIHSDASDNIVRALELGHSISTPFSFGFIVEPGTLMVQGIINTGTISLTDRMLLFSSMLELHDKSALGVWVGSLVGILLFVLWLVLPASKYWQAMFIAFAIICITVAFILQYRRPPHTFPYEQIIDVEQHGSLILLHVRDFTGSRPILFRLSDPARMAEFLAELRGKMTVNV